MEKVTSKLRNMSRPKLLGLLFCLCILISLFLYVGRNVEAFIRLHKINNVQSTDLSGLSIGGYKLGDTVDELDDNEVNHIRVEDGRVVRINVLKYKSYEYGRSTPLTINFNSSSITLGELENSLINNDSVSINGVRSYFALDHRTFNVYIDWENNIVLKLIDNGDSKTIILQEATTQVIDNLTDMEKSFPSDVASDFLTYFLFFPAFLLSMKNNQLDLMFYIVFPFSLFIMIMFFVRNPKRSVVYNRIKKILGIILIAAWFCFGFVISIMNQPGF